MRIVMIAAAAAIALAVLPMTGSASLAGTELSSQIQVGPDGVRIGDGHRRYESSRAREHRRSDSRRSEGRSEGRGARCAELRRACNNKDRLGEQGEGNCRRYRANCR